MTLRFSFAALAHITLGLAIVMVSNPSQAQSYNPKDFFQKHFAEGNGQVPPLPSQQRINQVQPANTPQAHDTTPSSNANSVRQQDTKSTGNPNAPWVEVYVNSQEKAHFENVVSELVRTVKKGKVRVSRLVHIGDFHNVSAGVKNQIAAAGLSLSAASRVPEKYSSAISPLWIITGDVGVRIVEGATTIEPFIDEHGNYVEPKAATPTPGAKMAGF